MTTATNPDAVLYRGFPIEPTFHSPKTGYHCKSVQGYEVALPVAMNHYRNRLWKTSIRAMKAEIDRLCDDVKVRPETRVLMLRAAGETERADQLALVAAAAKRADDEARAQREAEQAKVLALRDAAPDLLAALRDLLPMAENWLAAVVESVGHLPYESKKRIRTMEQVELYRAFQIAKARAAIAKAEGGAQ